MTYQPRFMMRFDTVEQQDLYKFVLWFATDSQGFYKQTVQILKQKFKDFPDKKTININDQVHLQYYATKFLISVLLMMGAKMHNSINSKMNLKVRIDDFGFVVSVFREDANYINICPASLDVKPKDLIPLQMSQQVTDLLTQVYGKDYLQQQKKKEVQMRIQHGGAPAVPCTMGLDVSTAVIGITIFQNSNNSLVFLDAVLLTRMLNKKKQQNTLINKLKLFKQYMQQLFKQKNIKITKLYIQEQRKRFGISTNANTLNKLRKFNGMVSGYLFERLKQLQQVTYVNVRSRRKIVLGKSFSKQQSYEAFKKIYKKMMNTQYVQTTPKDTNMDKSDSFIIALAGIRNGGKPVGKDRKTIAVKEPNQ